MTMQNAGRLAVDYGREMLRVRPVRARRAQNRELRRRPVQQAAIQQAAVANLSQAALRGASMETLHRLGSAVIRELLDVELCVVFESRGDYLRVVHLDGWEDEEARHVGKHLRMDSASQAAYALSTSLPVIVEDLQRETRFPASKFLLAAKAVSGMSVPIIGEHAEAWGVLGAHARRHRKFTTSDVDFVRAVAGVIGQAAIRSRSDEELRMRARQQSAISELSRLVMRSFDDSTFARTCDLMRECLDVEHASLFQFDQETRALRHRAGTQCELPSLPIVDKATASVSIVTPTLRFGVLTAQAPRHRRFTENDLEFMQALANVLAEGIERERATRALAESEERYREVIEGASEVIFTLSLDGKFRAINAAFEKVTGWSADEWIGRAYMDLVHPDERDHSRGVFRAVFERQESASDELTIIGKHGLVVIELTSFPKIVDGKTAAIYGFARNITEERRAERERQQLTRNLQLLLESTVEGILTFDLDGRCTMANAAAARTLGRSREELMGADAHALLHAGDAHDGGQDRDACPILAVAKTGVVRSEAQETFWQHDGTPIPVEYSAAPVLDDGAAIGVVVIFTDITERLKLEAKLEQAHRLSSLGRLAATVAHEFNNVLMGISPFVEVIRRGKDVEVATDQITRTIQRGKRVTQEILRFTQPAQPVRSAFDAEPWLNSIVLEAESLMPFHCAVEVEIDAKGLHIDGDASQLQQVFSNLILNARDAMSAGGVLTIGARREPAGARMPFGMVEHPERFAHFFIRDTGCGMRPETLRHIFEPLFTTKKSGTGLGLAVAHQVVMRHAGEMFVESTVGEGTTFHVFLPLAEECAPTASAPQAESAAATVASARLLLVEDDEIVAAGLCALLELEGVEVTRATTGGEAIELARRERPQVVVLDVGLPDMDGTAVYEQLSAMHPNLPIIFSTGHADRARLDTVADAENVAFLLKPYDSGTLVEAMRQVMAA